ncbi:MAG: retropepsin-like domain-containing protein [Candidatus Eremiobacteraeota bacterium]|nr:retropepsin-like domain-containing protein [Candidatus Eremiobacteraeota bacterium]
MTIFRFCLAAFTSIVLCLATASADETAAALQKHKTFTGWRFGDSASRYIDLTESTGEPGASSPATVGHIRRIGAAFRADYHDTKSGYNSSHGFTGNIFWYSDENGFTVPVLGEPAKLALAEDLFFADGWAELPWQARGIERRWGKTYHVFHVEQPSALSVNLYVDDETGSYAGVTIDPKGDNEETLRVLDYQSAGTKQFIKRYQFDGSKSVHTLSAITFSAFPDNDLHPPAQTASWDFKNSDPFPIKLTKDRIVIKARVNGIEGSFLLDSGAASIFLSGAFARRAGLKPNGHSQIYSLYGTEKSDVGLVQTLEMGGNVLRDVNVYFGSGEVEDEAPDGLMGFGLLAGALVTVDMEKSTMQVRDPANVDPKEIPGVRIGVDLSSGQPVVPMGVQDKSATVNALLDTGSPRVILISEQLPSKYGLHMTGAGVLGGCGFLDNMTIGPIIYDRPNACTVDWGVHEALIGYDFLKGLSKLHFDYAHAAMILTPRKPL